jgi:hypothetical protein
MPQRSGLLPCLNGDANLWSDLGGGLTRSTYTPNLSLKFLVVTPEVRRGWRPLYLIVAGVL